MIGVVRGGVATDYRYNGLGQRVMKTGRGGAIHYVYDESGRLLGEYDGAGEAIQETVYLDDLPVAVLKPGTRGNRSQAGTVTVNYVYADHLSTPRVLTRASDNKMVWRWDNADPFGLDQPDENPGRLGVFTYNPRFPGQVFDRETNHHYNYFRDYDPQTGRYVQSDPIGLAGGINTFTYALGNPLSQFDPNGLTTLVFNVETGVLTVDPEVAGRKPYDINVTSGKGECQNKSKCEQTADKGPLPRGKYEIYPSQIDNPSLMDDLRRNFLNERAEGGGDWGDWRVRIYPLPGTNRFGRTGFYLHGGYLNGLAGCIDIGGGIFGNDKLLKDLLGDPNNKIPLIVR